MSENQKTGDEKIVIVGFGWVGQANAIALVEMGYDVYFYDVLPPRHHYAKSHEAVYARITSLKDPLEVDGVHTSYMVAVGDRVNEKGEQDVSFIRQALESLRSAEGTVVLRSTIVPKLLTDLYFDYYVPEFLHEKFAIQECKHPYYFVIGSGTKERQAPLPLYITAAYERADKKFTGTYLEASYIKYFSNMWNAVRIAFANELGDVVADTSRGENPVADAERVINFMFEGKSYLRYGKGFGGHCLPKDMRAFLSAYSEEMNTQILAGAYASNRLHEEREKVKGALPEWFSAWDYDSILTSQKKVFEIFLKKVYNLPVITSIRRFLKPVVIAGEHMIPIKTLDESRALWEEKAHLNARYYANQKTKSGELVDESEIEKTGMEDYEKYIADDSALAPFRSIEAAPQGKKIVVLDIGSGIGRMTEFFAKDFHQVHGIDISPTMVESARKRLARYTNIGFEETDGKSIPFPDNAFDVIFSYQTLQHVADKQVIENYMKEIARTLRKGGVAKIQLRSSGGEVRRWVWSYGVSFTPPEVKQIAEQAGLRLVRDPYVEDIKQLWVVVTR